MIRARRGWYHIHYVFEAANDPFTPLPGEKIVFVNKANERRIIRDALVLTHLANFLSRFQFRQKHNTGVFTES